MDFAKILQKWRAENPVRRRRWSSPKGTYNRHALIEGVEGRGRLWAYHATKGWRSSRRM